MLSILLHVALFVVPLTLVYLLKRDPPMVTRIQLVQGADTGALRPDQAAPNPHQGPPPEDKAKGTPDAVPDPEKKKPEEKPKEEPKPKEKPKEEPKPKETPKEEAKPKEKPKEEPKPKEKPKEEAKPKEKPKEEAKPKEKPKEEAKPKEKPKADDKKKTEEKPKEKPKKPVVLEESDDSPIDEEMEELESVDTGPVGVEDGMEGLEEVHVAKNVGELTQGSAVEAADFPSALSYWATLVKRKVDRAWHGKVPPGLSLDAAEIKVRVGFWVNRNGEIIDDPVIVDGSFDLNLRESCIQAIKESLPLPPFPDTFTEAEQYITYVFTLTR